MSEFTTEEIIEMLKGREDVNVIFTDSTSLTVSVKLEHSANHFFIINNCDKEEVDRMRKLNEKLELEDYESYNPHERFSLSLQRDLEFEKTYSEKLKRCNVCGVIGFIEVKKDFCKQCSNKKFK